MQNVRVKWTYHVDGIDFMPFPAIVAQAQGRAKPMRKRFSKIIEQLEDWNDGPGQLLDSQELGERVDAAIELLQDVEATLKSCDA